MKTFENAEAAETQRRKAEETKGEKAKWLYLAAFVVFWMALGIWLFAATSRAIVVLDLVAFVLLFLGQWVERKDKV